jgi:hypothetical protein
MTIFSADFTTRVLTNINRAALPLMIINAALGRAWDKDGVFQSG